MKPVKKFFVYKMQIKLKPKKYIAKKIYTVDKLERSRERGLMWSFTPFQKFLKLVVPDLWLLRLGHNVTSTPVATDILHSCQRSPNKPRQITIKTDRFLFCWPLA